MIRALHDAASFHDLFAAHPRLTDFFLRPTGRVSRSSEVDPLGRAREPPRGPRQDWRCPAMLQLIIFRPERLNEGSVPL